MTQPYASLFIVIVQDPAIKKWSEVLSHIGEGTQPHFSEEFFDLFVQHIWDINGYGYAGIDFREDWELELLEGEDWDCDICKKNTHLS